VSLFRSAAPYDKAARKDIMKRLFLLRETGHEKPNHQNHF
jgi:hypothetical protein